MATENFDNPLVFNKIPDLLMAIVNVLIVIAIPIIVFFIIYSGFLYVTAKGNTEQIQKASKALLYGVIGGVIVIGAKTIMVIVGNTATAF